MHMYISVCACVSGVCFHTNMFGVIQQKDFGYKRVIHYYYLPFGYFDLSNAVCCPFVLFVHSLKSC